MNLVPFYESSKNSDIRPISITDEYSSILPSSFRNFNLDTKRSSSFKRQITTSQHFDKNKDMIESIKRRFQLQLQKEKQFSSLLIDKLKQEVDFLKLQNQNLKITNSKLKNSTQNLINQIPSHHTTQISKTSVKNQAENLKNMLQNLQKEHQNCILIKKDLLNTIQNQEIKIKVLQQENKKLQLKSKQCKKLSQCLKQVSIQNESYKKQIETLKKQVQSLKSMNNIKQLQFNKQLHQLQKSIEELTLKTQVQELKQKQSKQPFVQLNLHSKNENEQFYQDSLGERQIIEGLYKRTLYHLNKNPVPKSHQSFKEYKNKKPQSQNYAQYKNRRNLQPLQEINQHSTKLNFNKQYK